MKLKLFFTDPYYRWSTRESIKLKLESFPVIKEYKAYKIIKQMQKLGQWEEWDSWEQYMQTKEQEKRAKEIDFMLVLASLIVCLKDKKSDKKFLQEAKNEVLMTQVINEPQYQEFKHWIEGIELGEDVSRIEDIINSLRI